MQRSFLCRLVPAAGALLLAACANGYDDTPIPDGGRDDAGGGDIEDDAGREDAPSPDSGDDAATADDAGDDDAIAEDAAVEDAPPAEDTAEPDALWLCPPPGGLDCSTPGPGTGEGDECFDGVTCYMDEVQSAVRAVISAHPEWFDSTGGVCDVVMVDAAIYRQGVVDALNARGDVCGYADTNSVEEVVVRTNITYSENFDILSSAMCARFGPAIYTSTCAPAWI
jgi:hypothetical protein